MSNAERVGEKTFACRVCGVQCSLAGADGAICEDHCPDHNYVYIRGERGHFCENCGKPAPIDWFDD
jgi:hypothetical protein